MNSSIDQIFAQPQSSVADFEFNEQVAQVFPDMIKRSVPGYMQMLQGIGEIAHLKVQSNTRVYDLGCSLGAACLAIRSHVDDRACSIIGVDNSKAMLEQAQLRINAFKSPLGIELIQDDIQNIEIENASLVVLNFTMQFLPANDRQNLLNKIYRGLIDGGVLILSEKLTFESQPIGELLDKLHLNFKRANGYSELEISQKRTAIENVMKPDNLKQHHSRLNQAGFQESHTWFQSFNFASMVAIK